eukprot:2057416-Prymnesium_polylepis.1
MSRGGGRQAHREGGTWPHWRRVLIPQQASTRARERDCLLHRAPPCSTAHHPAPPCTTHPPRVRSQGSVRRPAPPRTTLLHRSQGSVRPRR